MRRHVGKGKLFAITLTCNTHRHSWPKPSSEVSNELAVPKGIDAFRACCIHDELLQQLSQRKNRDEKLGLSTASNHVPLACIVLLPL